MSRALSKIVRQWDRRRRRRLNSKPPSTPAGWVVGPPDFVGVGVQKCGTSWWFELIVAHPRVHRPHGGEKELRFFSPPWGDGLPATYHRQFARPPGELSGEWTPAYMHCFWAPRALRDSAPESRILVMMRDPIERLRSALTAEVGRSGSTSPPILRDQFARGLYASQLERLTAVYPREQVLVLQFEACRDQPGLHLERTFDFLGLDPSFRPDAIDRPVNETRQGKVPLSERQEDVLVEAYAADVQRLFREWPTLDPSLWRDYVS